MTTTRRPGRHDERGCLTSCPLGGAIFIALAPLPRLAAGLVALFVSLVEIAFWGGALSAFDYGPGQPFVQLQDTATWFGELGISYHVGFAGFGLWLVGLAVDRA